MDRELAKKYFSSPPTLITERLILRRMKRTDAKDMFEYASDPEVTRYLLWEPHADPHQTARYLAYIQSRYKAGEFFDWAVTDRRTGKMSGTCGFTRFNYEADAAEIGYVLNPRFWHIGIAPEAVRRVLRFGFEELALHRIEARYMCGNEDSRRVMEKVGMRFEGIGRDSMFVKGKYVSVGTCAILSNEFFTRRDTPFTE